MRSIEVDEVVVNNEVVVNDEVVVNGVDEEIIVNKGNGADDDGSERKKKWRNTTSS